MKAPLLSIYCAVLASCASSGPPPGVAPPDLKPAASIVLDPGKSDWNSMEDVRAALKGKPVSISGTTVDLKNCQLVGTRLKSYEDVQDERNQPLRIRIPGFTLKNGSTRDLPGGVLFRGPGMSFLNLTFLGRKSEDVLSNIVDQSPGATVRNCRAYGATDKSFQFNDASGLTFTGNYVTGGITGVRLQESSTGQKGLKTREVSGNTFESVDTAWNVSGGLKVVAAGNTYKNVATRWVQNSGASHTEK